MASPSRNRRLPFLLVAYGGIGLGTLGLVLPLLPTTPFLLVAAWAAPKGSPALARWLRRHPQFGPVLTAWRDQRAVPRRAKLLACCLMLSSWLMLWWTAVHPLAPPLFAMLFVGLAAFLLTRPEPRNP
jgi:uncharacterized protein